MEEIQELLNKFPETVKIYLVGGAVRDALLNKKNNDYDFVIVGASLSMMENTNWEMVGKSFPVFISPTKGHELAFARSEISTGQKHTDFECFTENVTLIEDLQRRDFTINAMAKEVRRDGTLGPLIDLHHGLRDLKKRQINHVSDNFADDPLRILRAARFAATLGFFVSNKTIEQMKKIVNSGSLSTITGNRIWNETVKAMLAPHTRLYWVILEQVGALKVLFPEFQRLVNTPQPAMHGGYSAWLHTLKVMELVKEKTTDMALIWAAMCHDFGKGYTKRIGLPHHYGHDHIGSDELKKLHKRLYVPVRIAKIALMIKENHMKYQLLPKMRPSNRLRLLESIDAFRKPEHMSYLQLIGDSDRQAKPSPNRHDLSNTPSQVLQETYHSSLGINTGAITRNIQNGEVIKRKIREARILEIKKNYKKTRY